MKLIFREAVSEDLNKLVTMLHSDPLGRMREDASLPLNESYITAFQAISSDPNNELIVAERDGVIIGMLQLTFIPYLTYIGSWRCLIEGVRVREDYRGQGLGKEMFRWALQRAREKKCIMVQLTSDKTRSGALEFYKSLGFTPSHEGFKMKLDLS